MENIRRADQPYAGTFTRPFAEALAEGLKRIRETRR